MTEIFVLGIDTSGRALNLGLAGNGILVARRIAMERGHAEAIFAEIGFLLEEAGIGYESIGKIAVICGPGSFTGLRIGLAAGRGLALGLGIPVIGIPTLLALSLGITLTGPFRIVRPAGRGQAYNGDFSAQGRPSKVPELVDWDAEGAATEENTPIVFDPALDVARMLEFARHAAPDNYPCEPVYVREADAKPQARFIVARQ